MDGFCLPGQIWILRADDDARVGGGLMVQSDKITLVDRQDGAPHLGCEMEDFGIWDRLISFSGFLARQYIMIEGA